MGGGWEEGGQEAGRQACCELAVDRRWPWRLAVAAHACAPETSCTAAPACTACLQVFLEDAGFDWKILGPDVHDFDYVAWQCDQDAYACSGQKCSAQSILFMHDAWAEAGACVGAVQWAPWAQCACQGPQVALGLGDR